MFAGFTAPGKEKKALQLALVMPDPDVNQTQRKATLDDVAELALRRRAERAILGRGTTGQTRSSVCV